MNIVNGFDIDTPEGATAYLESEGVDVESYIEKGMNELKKSKAWHLYRVSGSCDHPKYKQVGWHDSSILCEKCDCIIEQYGEKIDPATPLQHDR